MVVDPFHRCSFAKKVGGAQSVKNAQSTLKILRNLDFSSDLVHFLAEVGRALAKLGGLKPSQLNTFLHPCVGVSVVAL